ncbi:MAG TPA: type IV toxin-antitoxin system AbiEi family antitoxin domain-containing protein, partial [Actinomycetota bacterium]
MWQACVRLALRQEGLITLDQALGLGCSSGSFKGHVAKGDIERILPGVYRLSGAPESPRQRIRAACLWGGEGTAASHTSAAALVGLKGFTLADLHAVTPKDPRRSPEWLHLHQLPTCRPGTRPISGVPTTPPWITLVDLGSVAAAGEVRSALDQALHLGIVSLTQMRWALATFGRDRHRGTSVLRTLLAERGSGYAPPESDGEALFYALVEGSDLPPGVRQFPVWDGKRWRRLDYAWPDPGVGTEFDGWMTHG